MKKLFFLFLFFIQSLSAQETVPGKLLYIELGGPGVILSANYDARFKPNERLGFGYRFGVGFGMGKIKTVWVDKQWNYTYTEYLKRTYYTIPAGINYIFGKPNDANTFEIGAGVTFLTQYVTLYSHETKKPGHVIGFLTFMYRVMPVNGGFSFRIGVTPIIGTGGDIRFSGSIGFGYAF